MKKNTHWQVAFLKDHIGESIRKARIIKNISQQELALALNVERSTVSGWETGKRIPDMEMLGRLCAVLDIPMSSIMADSRQGTEKPLVMIVDDERVILKYNASIIGQVISNAETMCFTKPSDAIEFAKTRYVDLALLDIEMGTISGLDLCRELHEINPRTNVVYLTAYIDYSFDAWDTGACGFMLKPITPEGVKKQLKKLRYPFLTGGEQP